MRYYEISYFTVFEESEMSNVRKSREFSSREGILTFIEGLVLSRNTKYLLTARNLKSPKDDGSHEYLRVDNEFGTEFSSLNVNKSNGKLKFRFSKNN